MKNIIWARKLREKKQLSILKKTTNDRNWFMAIFHPFLKPYLPRMPGERHGGHNLEDYCIYVCINAFNSPQGTMPCYATQKNIKNHLLYSFIMMNTKAVHYRK